MSGGCSLSTHAGPGEEGRFRGTGGQQHREHPDQGPRGIPARSQSPAICHKLLLQNLILQISCQATRAEAERGLNAP